MAVVVHQKFTYKGQELPRGTVLTGSEAEALQARPQFRRFHNPAPDKHFAHLPKDAIVKPGDASTADLGAVPAAASAQAAATKPVVPSTATIASPNAAPPAPDSKT